MGTYYKHIDEGYSLEAHRRGASNEVLLMNTHNMFCGEIKKCLIWRYVVSIFDLECEIIYIEISGLNKDSDHPAKSYSLISLLCSP